MSNNKNNHIRNSRSIKRHAYDDDDDTFINKRNKSIWDNLNKYIYANCENNKINNKIDWISATKIKNYLIKDPILDWLSYRDKPSYTNNVNNMNILFEKGLLFEEKILNYLKKTYPYDFSQVSYNVSDINQKKVLKQRI